MRPSSCELPRLGERFRSDAVHVEIVMTVESARCAASRAARKNEWKAQKQPAHLIIHAAAHLEKGPSANRSGIGPTARSSIRPPPLNKTHGLARISPVVRTTRPHARRVTSPTPHESLAQRGRLCHVLIALASRLRPPIPKRRMPGGNVCNGEILLTYFMR